VKHGKDVYMDVILDVMAGIQNYIIFGLVIICFIFLILIIILFRALGSVEKRYRKFMRGVNNKNIEELIVGYLDKVDEAKNIAESVKGMYENIDNRLKDCVQKTSVIRYKAFEDVGSDLSFSIALLDDKNDGVILTGIYGRNESTTYAKPIDKGISRYDLSEEEMHVLNDAINKTVIQARK
jgi:Na+-transporting methylmalonyl-CoA/oxaloacetate decarboxylase gamma subunit